MVIAKSGTFFVIGFYDQNMLPSLAVEAVEKLGASSPTSPPS